MYRVFAPFSVRALALAALTALFAVGFLLPGGLAAAEPLPQPANGAQIEEVIITAQKRYESLQKVPIAVSVVQGQALQEENKNSLQDVAETLPDVHIVNSGGFANTLNIRGIGSGAGIPSFDQSVAMFDDDIYYGRSRMIAGSFLDMDRIEVLKGPQSTFFGNNAIAGAISMVTKKPDDHLDGYFRALYGSYGAYAAEGAVGGPINDMLAVRAAANFNGMTGWIRNATTNELAPGERNSEGRITAVLKPTNEFDATLKIEGGSSKFMGTSSNTPYQWDDCPVPPPLVNKSINKFCPTAIATGTPLGLNNNSNAGLPGQFALLETNEEVLTMNYRQWGHTFTSVTGGYGYRYTSQIDGADVLGTTVLSTKNTPEDYRQFSQEFRVTSPADQTIEYMAGLYFQRDTVNQLIDGNAAYLNPSLPALYTPANVALLTPLLPLGYDVGFTQKETIESAFGSLSWNVNEKLKLNSGLRGTRDHKDFVGSIAYGTETQTYGGFVPLPTSLQVASGVLLGAPGSYPYSRTDSALMGSAGAQYQINSEAMLYATGSHGFKAGGFNSISPSPISGASDSAAYGPETVNAYEVGVKSKWLDNRLLVNLDVFRMNYSGLQVNALVQLNSVNFTKLVKNAANSAPQGSELETQWNITDNVRLGANITYLDAYYVSFPNASPSYLQTQNKVKFQDLSGQPLDFASKWSGSVSAEYRVDLPNGYEFSAVLSPFFQTEYFNSAGTNDPNTLIKGSTRWDGKLTLESSDKHWAIDLIGKNLTDKVIAVLHDNNDSPGAKQEPRNVAVQVRYKW